MRKGNLRGVSIHKVEYKSNSLEPRWLIKTAYTSQNLLELEHGTHAHSACTGNSRDARPFRREQEYIFRANEEESAKTYGVKANFR